MIAQLRSHQRLPPPDAFCSSRAEFCIKAIGLRYLREYSAGKGPYFAPGTEVTPITMFRPKTKNSTVQPKLVVNEGEPEEQNTSSPDEKIGDTMCAPSPGAQESINATQLPDAPSAVACTTPNSVKRVSFDTGRWRQAVALVWIYAVVFVCMFGPIVIDQYNVYRAKSTWDDTFATADEAYRHNNFPKARSLFLKAGINAKRLYGSNSDQYLNTLMKLQWVFEDEHKFSCARAIAAKLRKLSLEQTFMFHIEQNITYALLLRLDKPASEFDKYDAASAELECPEYIELMQSCMGDISPGLVKPYSMMAKGFRFERNYPAAENCLETILKIRERCQGKLSVGATESKVEMGNLYVEWGHHCIKTGNAAQAARELAQAAQQYKEAATILNQLDSNSPNIDTLMQKGEIALMLQQRLLQQDTAATHQLKSIPVRGPRKTSS